MVICLKNGIYKLLHFRSTMSGPVAMELHPDLNKFNLKFLNIFGKMVMEEKLMPKALVEKYGNKLG